MLRKETISPELLESLYALMELKTLTNHRLVGGMKFNTFLCPAEYARYEKKDYTDIAFLLKEFSLDIMMNLYAEWRNVERCKKYNRKFYSALLKKEDQKTK